MRSPRCSDLRTLRASHIPSLRRARVAADNACVNATAPWDVRSSKMREANIAPLPVDGIGRELRSNPADGAAALFGSRARSGAPEHSGRASIWTGGGGRNRTGVHGFAGRWLLIYFNNLHRFATRRPPRSRRRRAWMARTGIGRADTSERCMARARAVHAFAQRAWCRAHAE